MNPFEQILRELGLIMNLPLHPDNHQACLLQFENGVSIQIEHNLERDLILLGSQISKLNPGIYREKILKEAMKSNGNVSYGKSFFAFSEKNDSLVAYQYISFSELNGQRLAEFVEMFFNTLKKWNEALSRGDIPLTEEAERSSSFLGLKP